MLKLRIFERDGIHVWLCDADGEPLRELVAPVGKLPGSVDWDRTAGSLRPLGEEGLELDLVFDKPEG